MVSRLVLGCDATGLPAVETFQDRPGELYVIESSESRVEQLRNEKVDARTGDVTDESTLESIPFEPDVIFVLGSDPNENLGAANAARAVYPEAYLIAFSGQDSTAALRADLEARVDTLFSPGSLLMGHLESILTDGHLDRLQDLRETLWGMDGRLSIFTHDNPDPDAIGSALALGSIAEWFGVESDIYYFGDISHQENRAFVNLLEADITNVDTIEEVDIEHLALVDHSAPGVNDQLPTDIPVDIVIDHHPSKTTVDADFVDVRSAVGATSTLLVDYLKGYDIDVETAIATGLLFGIRVDTRDFSQELTTADFEAAAFLLPSADIAVLGRIETPSVSPETLDILARAIGNRKTRGVVLTSCAGPIRNRDALAQAADRLLNLEHVRVTIVYGFREGTIYISARSRGIEMDLGETLRQAFGDIGSAGGHNNMAGAQISLGVFDAIDEESEGELTSIVEDVIETRFFDVLDLEDEE